jgi:Family of unknown function (DUF5924)/Protein of unknown function (DUF2914)
MTQQEGRPVLDAMASAPMPGRRGILAKAREFLRKNGKRLWWLHSVYALGLGALVVAFAQKGFDHARWLAISLSMAWLLVILFFRVFGSGARQENVDFAHARVRFRFFAMTYVLKNLYQGMLFFLLPFYWKSTTLGDPNMWFVAMLAACALLSTLDIVFDRVLMKWRLLASLFHGVTLFGCMNLVIPALFPDTPTLTSLLFAAGITVVFFWTLHVPVNALRKKWVIALFFASLAAGTTGIYFARRGIPPVPMHVPYAAVGPQLLKDGRLSMEVKTLHASAIHELICVTDVVVPGGHGDKLHHVWRRDGGEVERWGEETTRAQGAPNGIVRLRSTLQKRDLPTNLAGSWSVDVETEDGQLVGRATFRVVE